MQDQTVETDIRLAGLLTNKHESIINLSEKGPVLLVFLRHFGCIFCREALRDISQKRKYFESKGVTIVFVHMSNKETAEMYFRSFELDGIRHISDPNCKYYAAFGLGKGTISQLFGFKNLVRGFEATISKGIPVMTSQIGDGNQMPGVFIINKGQVNQEYRHHHVGEKPNYSMLLGL